MDLGLDRRSRRDIALVGRPGSGARAATLAVLLFNTLLAIQTTLSLLCSLLGLLGFAMTLRDIRHRLAIYENVQ